MKGIYSYHFRYLILLFLLFQMSILSAQDKDGHHEGESEEKEEHTFRNQRKNIVLFSFGYTFIPEEAELNNNESNGVFIPSFGLDYKRRLNEKWALSLFLDYELERYLLIDKELKRERAFIAAIGGSYELLEGLGLFAGVGREFEKNENLTVIRGGLEYGFDLGENWILVSSLFYDWKEKYHTYSFSLGISRKF